MNIQNALNDAEYLSYTEDILKTEEFKKLKGEQHHMFCSRYEHNVSVSYTSFKIARALRMDVRSATRAALLHDFYFDADGQGFSELICELDGTRCNQTFFERIKRIKPKHAIEGARILFSHPFIAAKRAKEYFGISPKEENIIKSHMWPVGLVIPRYKESWLVTLVDNAYTIGELSIKYRKLATACTLLLIIW